MKKNRKAMREALLKRTQESHERREDTGRFATIFKEDIQGIKFWKCVEGEHLLDIIPYIAGTNNSNVKSGEPAYVLDVWVHYSVGVNEDAFICPARTYGKNCPICEHQKKLKDEGEEDEITKLLNPKRRALYNILCYDNDKEEAKGVQVWDAAHWFTERHLTPLAKKPKGGGFVLFADPDEGKAISFERKGMGATNTEFIGHKFVDRDYTIHDDILDEAHCLDEIVIIPTYDELNESFWGTSEEEKEEKEEKKEKPEVKEEAKEETPRQKARRLRAERKKKKEEEKEKEGPKCPGGGEFGVDLDTIDYCDDCELWDDCAKKNDEIEEQEN